MIGATYDFDKRTKISYIKFYKDKKLIHEFGINDEETAKIIVMRINRSKVRLKRQGWGN